MVPGAVCVCGVPLTAQNAATTDLCTSCLRKLEAAMKVHIDVWNCPCGWCAVIKARERARAAAVAIPNPPGTTFIASGNVCAVITY